jgi:hypothetical protein
MCVFAERKAAPSTGPPGIAAFLLAQFQAAYCTKGGPMRFLGRHPGGDIFLEVALDVIADLVGLLFDLAASKQRTEPHSRTMKHQLSSVTDISI